MTLAPVGREQEVFNDERTNLLTRGGAKPFRLRLHLMPVARATNSLANATAT